MKKIFAGFGILIAVGLIVVLGVFIWWKENTKPVSTNTEVSDFVITKGTNAEKVGQQLYEKGFIKSPLAFKFYVQLFDKTQKIQAGQFKLSPSYTMTQVVDALSKGPTELWVTIPEGLRREEVAEKVITALELKGEDAETFRIDFLKQTEGLEGMLFPDTYLFARDANAQKVVSTLKNTFDKRIADLGGDVPATGYSTNQIIVLASILERETKNKDPEERPTVAGIYYNRLKLGMPLQADATLQYAIANDKCQMANGKCEDWWPTVFREDYTFKSPYNTYANNGIPPKPISNPGLSSLKGAVHPIKTDYLFYIHDKEGVIHYAKTLLEHNKNAADYIGK
jgi:UPF0755 protein